MPARTNARHTRDRARPARARLAAGFRWPTTSRTPVAPLAQPALAARLRGSARGPRPGFSFAPSATSAHLLAGSGNPCSLRSTRSRGPSHASVHARHGRHRPGRIARGPVRHAGGHPAGGEDATLPRRRRQSRVGQRSARTRPREHRDVPRADRLRAVTRSPLLRDDDRPRPLPVPRLQRPRLRRARRRRPARRAARLAGGRAPA